MNVDVMMSDLVPCLLEVCPPFTRAPCVWPLRPEANFLRRTPSTYDRGTCLILAAPLLSGPLCASLIKYTMPLIDIVVVRFDTFVCTLIFETKPILSPKYDIFNWECCVGEISNVSWSVRKPYLRVRYHVSI